MPSDERDNLVSGPLSTNADGSPKEHKPDKFRGMICWGIFGAFLIFFIIMAAVYTDPKGYKAANPADYLSGEDAVLYQGLGGTNLVPSTKKMNALAYFQLGLKLLNLFWYDLAIEKFQEAQELDPKLAIAYWGEAMCYKQPLWQTEDVTAALEVLKRMDERANVPLSGREAGYIDAVRALYNINNTLQTREEDYADRMRNLADEYMDLNLDGDTCALAALALLGKVQSIGDYLDDKGKGLILGEVDTRLKDCIQSYPEHAGARNYQVHLYDLLNDPYQASEAMAAAQKLAALAPKSNLAQHMVSHIALRQGNWSQVVSSNKAAVAASDEYCNAIEAGNDCDADNRWHALEWQLYGQTQQCSFLGANSTYRRMQAVAASMNYSDEYGLWLYRTYAHLQLQSVNSGVVIPLFNSTSNAMLPGALYDAASIETAADISDHFWPPHAEVNALLARVSSLTLNRTAAQLQAPDVQTTLSAALTRLDSIVARQENLTAAAAASNSTKDAKPNEDMKNLLTTVQLQAKSLVVAAACNAGLAANCSDWRPWMDQALALHNQILGSTTLPTLKIAPTPEFYGNLLLMNVTNATAAAAMFDQCLNELPNRMLCLAGRARAAAQMGDMATANIYYRALSAQCAGGDPKFPPLAEARLALTRVPPSPRPPSKKGRLLRRALA